MEGSPLQVRVKGIGKKKYKDVFLQCACVKNCFRSIACKTSHFPTPRHILLPEARYGENLAEGIAWDCFYYLDIYIFCSTYKASVLALVPHSPPTEAVFISWLSICLILEANVRRGKKPNKQTKGSTLGKQRILKCWMTKFRPFTIKS